jgi:hypothetical protein
VPPKVPSHAMRWDENEIRFPTKSLK